MDWNKELHRIVATAIIHRGNKFLIVRRALDLKVFPGKWTVPGGGMTIDDYQNEPPTTKDGSWYYSLENTLRREILEEVGLEVGEIKYLLDLTFIRPDKIPVLTLSFYAPWLSGEVTLSAENTDHAWVTAGEARDYDLIAGIPEELQMVERIFAGQDPRLVKIGE